MSHFFLHYFEVLIFFKYRCSLHHWSERVLQRPSKRHRKRNSLPEMGRHNPSWNHARSTRWRSP